MADVKESAMSTASDCKWVRALDANGNSIRISKEDHARVVGGLIGTATSSKDGLIPKKLMPISVNSTETKRLFRLTSFSTSSKIYAVFVVSINKTQYLQPYSYIVNFSYNSAFGMSNALNTNGKYSKGETPFYYKQSGSTIDLFIETETYCPLDIIPLSVTGGTITFEESSEEVGTLSRL